MDIEDARSERRIGAPIMRFQRLLSGSSHVEKPYLVLAPVLPEALQFYEDDFLSDINSK